MRSEVTGEPAARTARARILGALSRVTSSGRFIAEIDGLRAVAILSVVAFHVHNTFFPANPLPPSWGDGPRAYVSYAIHNGWFGVQLFFVISGFILALPFAERHLRGGERVDLRRYLWRRVTRLEPPYLISLAVLFATQIWFMHADVRTLLPHLAAHAGYVHNLVYGELGTPGYVAVNHVAWSLEIEVQFYLLAPLMCAVFTVPGPAWRRRAIVVAAIAGGIVLERVAWTPMLPLTIAGQLRWFLIGLLLADFYLTTWREAQRTARWDAIGGIVWFAGPIALTARPISLWVMPVIVFAGYAAAFRGRQLNRLFAHPWIAALGGMCYSIYLYHVWLIEAARRLVDRSPIGPLRYDALPASLVQLVVICGVVVLMCVPMYLLLEKPFMRRRPTSPRTRATPERRPQAWPAPQRP